ncbi:phytoene/squalene synthase family protein [Daejeonella oryzae]|uniref:phytoene/squalene synthase family protein n=1 Tax=Daejeonella oryzae TaxID=1122943 RepID=UPI0004050355|nr:squalene/phytoene synthase family protein [Daejeonella oryzae]
MMDLYNETCFECSKIITQKYSTSFSSGIRAFAKKFHYPIYGIYGFVRYADEIVDTFHDHDKFYLISDFKAKTFEAIHNKISLNPVLHSFQQVVNTYSIDYPLIEAFLNSMEMDLDKTSYTDSSYKEYIYGSAEVVGLMCLKVFCEGDQVLHDRLIPTARSLGAAFQKINFLRDIQSDYEDRGRTYFPSVDFANFTEADKREIENEIKIDFDHALEGIKQLPASSRKGVYIAYVYYCALFDKIKSTPANLVAQKRIRVSDQKKMLLMAQAVLKIKLNVL